MDNDYRDNSLYNILIDKILDNKLKQLLTIINKTYPTKFKKEFIEIELKYIKQHINIKPYTKQIQVTDIPNKISENENSTSTIMLEPKIKPVYVIDDSNRCNGRIWSSDIFNRKTMKIMNDIPQQFKVIDFKDINIDKFNTNYIIGLQCKKSKYKNSNYCKLHMYHLIHGDFKDMPNKELCYHFIKDGNYL